MPVTRKIVRICSSRAFCFAPTELAYSDRLLGRHGGAQGAQEARPGGQRHQDAHHGRHHLRVGGEAGPLDGQVFTVRPWPQHSPGTASRP